MGDSEIQRLYDTIEKEEYLCELSAAENAKLKQQIQGKHFKIQQLTARFDSLKTEYDELLCKSNNAATALEEEKRAREQDLLDIIAKEAFINYLKDVNEDLKKHNQSVLEDNEELSVELEKLKGILSNNINLHLFLEAEKFDEDAAENKEQTEENLHYFHRAEKLENIVEEAEELQNNSQSVHENSSGEAKEKEDVYE